MVRGLAAHLDWLDTRMVDSMDVVKVDNWVDD